MGLSVMEILVIVAIVLLLFGSKRIPELARALGRASHEYKKAKNQLTKESEEIIDAAEKSAAASEKKTPAAGKEENKSN